MAKRPQVTNQGVVWVEEGEQASPTGQAGEVGWWDILKRAPEAFKDTFGEVGLTLNKVGEGGEGADDVGTGREWLQTNLGLENQGGESIPEALLKGAAEGLLDTFVPEAGVDVGANIIAEGAGGALAGARGLEKGVQAADKAARATRRAGSARRGATGKLQKAAQRPQQIWQGAPGGGKPPGYHTQRMAKQGRRGVDLPPSSPESGVTRPEAMYRGPRPTEPEFTQYRQGTGQAAGIPDELRPGTTSPVGQQALAADKANQAYAARQDPVAMHQRNMQQFREGQKALETFDKGVMPQAPGQVGPPRPMTLDDINNLPPETRQILEQQILHRAQRAPSAAPPATPPPRQPAPGGMPTMGTPQDLQQVAQATSDAKVAGQQNQLGALSPQEQGDILTIMQELLAQPGMTMDKFMGLMKNVSGGIF